VRAYYYTDYADLDHLAGRLRALVADRKMDGEIAAILNAEGLLSARGRQFSGGEIHLLCKRWGIATVKINNGKEANPLRWPDGTYSVQGAAEALSITPQTVFDWLQKGRLSGKQLARGMPWKIGLTDSQIAELRPRARNTKASKNRGIMKSSAQGRSCPIRRTEIRMLIDGTDPSAVGSVVKRLHRNGAIEKFGAGRGSRESDKVGIAARCP
jgi:hypothetical protein